MWPGGWFGLEYFCPLSAGLIPLFPYFHLLLTTSIFSFLKSALFPAKRWKNFEERLYREVRDGEMFFKTSLKILKRGFIERSWRTSLHLLLILVLNSFLTFDQIEGEVYLDLRKILFVVLQEGPRVSGYPDAKCIDTDISAHTFLYFSFMKIIIFCSKENQFEKPKE